MKLSSVSLLWSRAWCWATSLPRRMSAQKRKKTPQSAIQAISGSSVATKSFFSCSRTTMMLYWLRSDFEGADCAQARSISSVAGSTGLVVS